jgi:GTPase SAR1 family protein
MPTSVWGLTLFVACGLGRAGGLPVRQVIIMGDGSVGKTSLVMRFTKDYFSTTYKQTIGLDFFIKRLEMPSGTCMGLRCRSRGVVLHTFGSLD